MSNHEGLVRSPAVAGRFYPADPQVLEKEVKSHLDRGRTSDPVQACAVMAPHAGYVYSGDIAGKVFAAVEVPRRVIVLCPNHTGMGTRISVIADGVFRMPSKDVPIDRELAAAVLDEVTGASTDDRAHLREHAIEVELPFLQARQPNLAIVPIVLAGLDEREAVALGEQLHKAASRVDGDVLIVASSDMSHYLPDDETRRLDRVALEPLLAFDPGGLYRTVRKHDISMCGFIPATAMLAYARRAGAQPPELVGYATSGDAFGDRDRVVGYAGVVVKTKAG